GSGPATSRCGIGRRGVSFSAQGQSSADQLTVRNLWPSTAGGRKTTHSRARRNHTGVHPHTRNAAVARAGFHRGRPVGGAGRGARERKLRAAFLSERRTAGSTCDAGGNAGPVGCDG